MASLSLLQQYRLGYKPKLPAILEELTQLVPIQQSQHTPEPSLGELFSKTSQQPLLAFQKGEKNSFTPLNIGVVLSGGQAPGGHSVIAGLFDALKKFNPQSRLIGFREGPNGIVKNKAIEITEELLAIYRNQGGFDLLGSGRTKIETVEQFKATEESMRFWDLDGLVIIGGDDSNTNAAFLAEYFEKQGMKTKVVGVPKTIDGDLKNEWIEVSFGFDTACKIYSEIIGNILKDALSAKKYYYFIKLMGRSASHITLECELQTHANLALIGEEVAEKKYTLDQIVQQIAEMICFRADQNKNYGAILIPEGIIEFIPEFKQMIQELNEILTPQHPHFEELERIQGVEEKVKFLIQHLTQEASNCLLALPWSIQEQIMFDRDPHGNVQVSKIETERLLMELVDRELKKRKQAGTYKGKFSAQPLFCGYEGRSGLPSNFDCQYCYALGHVAALLLNRGATGYMCCVKDLTKPVEQWRVFGVPIFSLLHMELREGKRKPVIQKALVDLKRRPFQTYVEKREEWFQNDDYLCPGPIQFDGPVEITDYTTLTLRYEQDKS